MFRSKGVAARLLIMVVALIGVSISRAEAITLREIVELTRAGLSDDVLLALIEVDQRVFEIDPDTLKGLKDAGVSTRVIVAIVKSGRTPAPPAEPIVDIVPPDPPPPQVVVVDRPVVHEVAVAVPVPVYVAVGGRSRVRHRDLPYVSAIAVCSARNPNAVSCRSARTPQARGTGVLGLGREAQARCLATCADAAQQALAAIAPAIDWSLAERPRLSANVFHRLEPIS